jgi:hypothetical protein
MKIAGLIATCSTMLLCSMLITSYFEIESTDKITTAIEEKPSVSQTYNHYETNNYYEDDDTEKIEELEEKINELETEETESNEEVLVGVNQYGVVVNTQPQEIKEPWSGPKNYKCDKMAGYPAICGYCGEQGEIHFNIKEWQDEQGTYHLTHVGCGQKYCEKMHIEPRIEESYKIR